ncbi:MAG: molybdopterin-guanine dinucleotide biosynthesis protein A, partial [Alphaproteobacteria bacterium]
RLAVHNPPHPNYSSTFPPGGGLMGGPPRPARLGFVTGMTQRQMQAPYPMSHVVFAKGEQAEKLLIVALQDGPFDTIFRARAFLAAMTAAARATPIFGDLEVETTYTFFDLAMLLGFSQITISDGKSFSHQIELK